MNPHTALCLLIMWVWVGVYAATDLLQKHINFTFIYKVVRKGTKLTFGTFLPGCIMWPIMNLCVKNVGLMSLFVLYCLLKPYWEFLPCVFRGYIQLFLQYYSLSGTARKHGCISSKRHRPVKCCLASIQKHFWSVWYFGSSFPIGPWSTLTL